MLQRAADVLIAVRDGTSACAFIARIRSPRQPTPIAVLEGGESTGKLVLTTEMDKGTMTAQDTDLELQREILDIERQRVAAMVDRDLAALDRILADDLTYTIRVVERTPRQASSH